QNIAFMVGLAFSIAASCNFPVLFLSMYWKDLTTRGALFGGAIGLFTALVLTILSPTVWVQVLGNAEAIFPYSYPALFSVSAASSASGSSRSPTRAVVQATSVRGSSRSSFARRPGWVPLAP